jgi:hypothetical protein
MSAAAVEGGVVMRALVLLHPRTRVTRTAWAGRVMPYALEREYALTSITNVWRDAVGLAEAGEVDVVLVLSEPPLRAQRRLLLCGVKLEVVR